MKLTIEEAAKEAASVFGEDRVLVDANDWPLATAGSVWFTSTGNVFIDTDNYLMPGGVMYDPLWGWEIEGKQRFDTLRDCLIYIRLKDSLPTD